MSRQFCLFVCQCTEPLLTSYNRYAGKDNIATYQITRPLGSTIESERHWYPRAALLRKVWVQTPAYHIVPPPRVAFCKRAEPRRCFSGCLTVIKVINAGKVRRDFVLDASGVLGSKRLSGVGPTRAFVLICCWVPAIVFLFIPEPLFFREGKMLFAMFL